MEEIKNLPVENGEVEKIRHDLEQLKAAGWIRDFRLYRDLNYNRNMLTLVLANGDTKQMSRIVSIKFFLKGFKEGMATAAFRYAMIEERFRGLLDELDT